MTKGLAILFAEANHARLHAGLTLACAAVALGRPVRLFFHGEAVAALQCDRRWGGDQTYATAGLPSIGELITSAMSMGARVMACQSGLQMLRITPASLAEGVETAGMVAFLADARDDDLLMT